MDAKTVEIDGKSYLVSPANLAAAIRRDRIADGLAGELDAVGVTDTDTLQAASLYPALAACTDNPPSLAAFLAMRDIDADTWFLTVRSVNPHWFPKSDKLPND